MNRPVKPQRKRAKQTRCITAGCRNLAKHRGLCPNCYTTAREIVKKNRATWDELVEMGLVQPARPRSCFVVAFEIKMAEKNKSK